jgi:hypothetical protein
MVWPMPLACAMLYHMFGSPSKERGVVRHEAAVDTRRARNSAAKLTGSRTRFCQPHLEAALDARRSLGHRCPPPGRCRRRHDRASGSVFRRRIMDYSGLAYTYGTCQKLYVPDRQLVTWLGAGFCRDWQGESDKRPALAYAKRLCQRHRKIDHAMVM